MMRVVSTFLLFLFMFTAAIASNSTDFSPSIFKNWTLVEQPSIKTLSGHIQNKDWGRFLSTPKGYVQIAHMSQYKIPMSFLKSESGHRYSSVGFLADIKKLYGIKKWTEKSVINHNNQSIYKYVYDWKKGRSLLTFYIKFSKEYLDYTFSSMRKTYSFQVKNEVEKLSQLLLFRKKIKVKIKRVSNMEGVLFNTAYAQGDILDLFEGSSDLFGGLDQDIDRLNETIEGNSEVFQREVIRVNDNFADLNGNLSQIDNTVNRTLSEKNIFLLSALGASGAVIGSGLTKFLLGSGLGAAKDIGTFLAKVISGAKRKEDAKEVFAAFQKARKAYEEYKKTSDSLGRQIDSILATLKLFDKNFNIDKDLSDLDFEYWKSENEAKKQEYKDKYFSFKKNGSLAEGNCYKDKYNKVSREIKLLDIAQKNLKDFNISKICRDMRSNINNFIELEAEMASQRLSILSNHYSVPRALEYLSDLDHRKVNEIKKKRYSNKIANSEKRFLKTVQANTQKEFSDIKGDLVKDCRNVLLTNYKKNSQGKVSKLCKEFINSADDSKSFMELEGEFRTRFPELSSASISDLKNNSHFFVAIKNYAKFKKNKKGFSTKDISKVVREHKKTVDKDVKYLTSTPGLQAQRLDAIQSFISEIRQGQALYSSDDIDNKKNLFNTVCSPYAGSL